MNLRDVIRFAVRCEFHCCVFLKLFKRQHVHGMSICKHDLNADNICEFVNITYTVNNCISKYVDGYGP